MDAHKTIGVFDPSKESWISYTERLGQFYIATDICDSTLEIVLYRVKSSFPLEVKI